MGQALTDLSHSIASSEFLPNAGEYNCCALINRTKIVFLGDSNDRFTVLDAEGGEKIADIVMNWLEKEKSSKIEWHALSTYALNSEKTCLLGLILKVEENKQYLWNMELKLDECSITLIDECRLDVEESSEIQKETVSVKLIHDENDQFYCLVPAYNAKEASTTFKLIKIDIDESGNILCDISAVQANSIENIWFHPFITGESLYFLHYISPSEKMIIIPQTGQALATVDICFGTENRWSMNTGSWSPPFHSNNFIFHYVYYKEAKSGFLWKLDLEGRRWLKYAKLVDHVISICRMLLALEDGTLFLKGTCLNHDCQQKVHIYKLADSSIIDDKERENVHLMANVKLKNLISTDLSNGDEHEPVTESVSHKGPEDAIGALHERIICDICGGPVRGDRFKCTSCLDFDLCSTCEQQGKHSEHIKKRIAHPRERTWMEQKSLRVTLTMNPDTFPGVSATQQFSVSSDGSKAALFNFDSDCFVITHFINCELEGRLKREPFKTIEGPTMWLGLQFCSDTFLCSLIFEYKTCQYYFVSFQEDFQKNIFRVKNEHLLDLKEEGNFLISTSSAKLLKDECGKIYVARFWWNVEQPETVFDVVRVFVDELGDIQSEILINSRAVDNLWHCPFITNDSIYFFSALPSLQMQILNNPITTIDKSYIITVSSDGATLLPSIGNWSPLCISEDRLWLYSIKNELKTGGIWSLELKSANWTKHFEFDRHSICDLVTLCFSDSRKLFLHGNCAEVECIQKAHIYVFDYRKTDDTLSIEENAHQLEERRKIFMGVRQSRCCCLTPDESKIIIYDQSRCCFIFKDLTSGRKFAEIKRAPFSIIDERRTEWLALQVFNMGRGVAFLCAIVRETASRKCFLASFDISFAPRVAKVVDEHILDAVHLNILSSWYITPDNKSQMYCICYLRIQEPHDATLISVYKTDIDDFGTISTVLLADSREIEGHWSPPFIHTNAICTVPLYGSKHKINVTQMEKDSQSYIGDVSSAVGISLPNTGIPSYPVRYSYKQVIFYFANIRQERAEVWAIHMETLKWKKLIEIKDHAIVEWPTLLVNNDRLIVHGHCVESDCSERAHVQTINWRDGAVEKGIIYGNADDKQDKVLSKDNNILPLKTQQGIKSFTDAFAGLILSGIFKHRPQHDLSGLPFSTDDAKNMIMPREHPAEHLCSRFSSMFTTGLCAARLFTVHPRQDLAIIFDPMSATFTLIGFNNEQQRSEIKLERFDNIRRAKWECIHCVERRKSKCYIVAIVYDHDNNCYYLISIELKLHELILTVVEEHRFLQVESEYSNNLSTLTVDEHCQLYCVNYWQEKDISMPHTKWKSVHVAKINIDDYGKIWTNSLKKFQLEDHNLRSPFICNGTVYFLAAPFNGEFFVTLSISSPQRRAQFLLITVGEKNDRASPPKGQWSTPCVRQSDHLVLFYIFAEERSVGEVWALDLRLRKWTKYFTLHKHALDKNAQLAIDPENRIFLHGECAEKYCPEKAHFYHFGITLFGKRVYPTIEQLGALYSESKTVICHGPGRTGKSIILLFRALNVLISTKDQRSTDSFRLYIAKNQAHYTGLIDQTSGLNEKFAALKNVFILDDDFLNGETIPNSCDVFIDGADILTFVERKWMQKRTGKTFIAVNDDLWPGLEHPRERVSWNRLLPILSYKANDDEYLPSIHYAKKQAIEPKKFPEQAKEAMDQFYGNWCSTSFDRETVCIPTSLDIGNRYRGPVDSDAAGFNAAVFEQKRQQVAGQPGEDAFLQFFQKMRIGGVLISGFSSAEFAKIRNMKSLFKGISDMEIDAMFIHPHIGIILFEVKATKETVEVPNVMDSKVYRKAMKQLEKMKYEMPKVITKICAQSCRIPILFAICFPFAKFDDIVRAGKNVLHIDGALLENSEKLKEAILEKASVFAIEKQILPLLQRFTCIVAGYRALSYLSAGHNTLEVYNMLNQQSYNEPRCATDPYCLMNIILTGEQLGIVDCSKQFQIMSGAPGTGKTLIILHKALQAALRRQTGSVCIITGSEELRHKFQNYFKQFNGNIVRYPIIKDRFNHIEPDDDVFIDELVLADSNIVAFLKQRLSAKGITVAALTGFSVPLQVIKAEELIRQYGLADYYHFKMHTVLRCSKSIINEWKKEFPSDFPIYVGHGITGPAILRIQASNRKTLLNSLLINLKSVLSQYQQDQDAPPNNAKKFILPQHIAVLTEDTASAKLVKVFLASNGIPCGSIQEQMSNSKLVTVSFFDNSLSFEWPIVYALSMQCKDFCETFYLIAASRCIVKFVSIERDYMAVQHKVDVMIAEIAATGTEIDYSTIHDCVDEARKELGETEEEVPTKDAIFAIIRHNLYPRQLMQSVEAFEQCQSLLDCIQVVTKHSDICHLLLDNPHVRSGVGRHQLKPWVLSGRIPKYLDSLWSNLSIDSKAQTWTAYSALLNKLASVQEENKICDQQETQMGKEQLSATLSHTFGWIGLRTVIEFLCVAT